MAIPEFDRSYMQHELAKEARQIAKAEFDRLERLRDEQMKRQIQSLASEYGVPQHFIADPAANTMRPAPKPTPKKVLLLSCTPRPTWSSRATAPRRRRARRATAGPRWSC